MAEMNRNLARLSDSDFEIADGEPDVKGWEVFSSDNRRIGEVDELIIDTTARKVRFLECELDENELGLEDRNRHCLIPVGYARLDEDDDKIFVEGLTTDEIVALPATMSDIDTAHEERFETAERELRLTRSEEELEVGKREVEAGEVDVEKHVETEHVSRPVSRMHEEVEIERRPASGTTPESAEFREQEIRVPVREEKLEVRKRPEVKEELVVRKRPVTETEEVETDLRKEEIDVEERGRLDRER